MSAGSGEEFTSEFTSDCWLSRNLAKACSCNSFSLDASSCQANPSNSVSRLSCRQEKRFAVFSRLFICPEKSTEMSRQIHSQSAFKISQSHKTPCSSIASRSIHRVAVSPLLQPLAPWERDTIWPTPQVKTLASTSTKGQRLWRDNQLKTSHQVTWPRCRNTKTRDEPPSESISRDPLHPHSCWTTERSENPDARSAFKPQVCRASIRDLNDASRDSKQVTLTLWW